MESTSTTILDLEKLCVETLCAFVSAIGDSIRKGFKPIILTISRRMPHILFWYKNTHASDEHKQILNETETISEIALPFIDFKKKENFKIFLIDDIVSSGRTIEYVKILTEIITEKNVSDIYTLFCNAYSPFLIQNSENTICGFKYAKKEDKSKIIDFISTVIAVTLPIDVTYPVLHFNENITEPEFKKYQKIFKDNASIEAENYSISILYRMDLKAGNGMVRKGERNESFTALMPSVISNLLNNDFAKIRTYKRLTSFILVPYAPNILTDENLSNKDLFESKYYKKVWNSCLAAIKKEYLKTYSPFDQKELAFVKELVRNRSFRSLASVANYLYSLSAFNKLAEDRYEEIKHDIGDYATSFTVRVEDLTLLVGKTISEEIMNDIRIILVNRYVSPRRHSKVLVPSIFIPKIYEQDYFISRYLSMPIGVSTLEERLRAIFRNASSEKKRYPAFQLVDIEYDVEGVMESFESIENTLYTDSYEDRIDINRWVDERIDNGEIVSRYACVKDDNGVSHWRRFFRLSSSLAD